jgi:hypothetical protein
LEDAEEDEVVTVEEVEEHQGVVVLEEGGEVCTPFIL